VIFVFLILDFNTFLFYGGPPWKPRIYVTGASSLKIVFIIIIIIIIIGDKYALYKHKKSIKI